MPSSTETRDTGQQPRHGRQGHRRHASPPDPTAAITVADLHKSYPGRGRGARPVPALAGIGFTVPAGTVFGLLGPNGAGKSTTVKILSTLSRADSGTASVAGYDVRRDPGLVRRSIGLVTQKSGTDLDATGRENLWLQGRLYGLGGPRLTRRVDELLDRFDLGAAADRLARTYSGGMLRRLDVAVGLVHRPSCSSTNRRRAWIHRPGRPCGGRSPTSPPTG